jgi:hypothetical protein
MGKLGLYMMVLAAVFLSTSIIFLVLWLNERDSDMSGKITELEEHLTAHLEVVATMGTHVSDLETETERVVPSFAPLLTMANAASHMGETEYLITSIGGVASNAVADFFDQNGKKFTSQAYRQMCHAAHPGYPTGIRYVYIRTRNVTGALVSQDRRALTETNASKRWCHGQYDRDRLDMYHHEDLLGVKQYANSFEYAMRHGLDEIHVLDHPFTAPDVHALYRALHSEDPEHEFELRPGGNPRSIDSVDDPWARRHIEAAALLCDAPVVQHVRTLDLPHGVTSPALLFDGDDCSVVFRRTRNTHTGGHNIHTLRLDSAFDVVDVAMSTHPYVVDEDDLKLLPANGDCYLLNNRAPGKRVPSLYSTRERRLVWQPSFRTNPVEKNYTPYAVSGELYLIRWFVPLEVYRVRDGTDALVHKQDGPADQTWRGGTNGLYCEHNKCVFGFGRRTMLQHRDTHGLLPDFTHRAFFWTLDINTWKLTTHPCTGPCGRITDPVSLAVARDRLWLSTVEGSGSFDKSPLTLKCEIYDATEFVSRILPSPLAVR